MDDRERGTGPAPKTVETLLSNERSVNSASVLAIVFVYATLKRPRYS